MSNENLNRLNKKYIDLLFRMQSNSLCKANVGDYLVYKKDWLFNHLEEEFELQRSMKEIKEKKEKSKEDAKQNICNEICNDNRFEIIQKAKEDIISATNIEDAKDEMECLDSFLFRCWQMGWLDKYKNLNKSN